MGKKNFVILFFVLLVLTFFPLDSYAESKLSPIRETSITIQTSIFSRHWSNNYRYNNHHQLLGLEYHKSRKKFFGVVYFKNSFNQPCYYFYIGKRYYLKSLVPQISVYSKITSGIVHGYDDENGKYDGSLNKLKTFPAIVPGLELEYKIFTVSLIIYASAGFMVTSGMKF